ncbi:MAG: T9SS type A sorting domain-containing protein [Saprospiraceae bacterium]|nr:T9SS type A sorting domain-containing protein [Saprospiraceae bacterium]
MEIISNANFADVLTLFTGDCNQLTEVQCEHLGNKIIFQNPSAKTKYYLQVSGYFSTIEGNICVDIKERTSQKPVHDDCLNATAIVLGQTCIQSQNVNSLASNIKSSCMVYAAPDIWYSFIAPAEKEVGIQIQSGFMFNYAIYEGPCNKLTEITCGKQPDPCKGFLSFKGLIAGKTYYLQISSIVHPLRVSESSICIKIDPLSQLSAFSSLDLNLSTECIHGVLGRINYTATGGRLPYQYTGPSNDEYFLPGSKVEAFIEDASGCRDFASLTIQCLPPEKCKNTDLDIQVTSTCLKDSIGRQTGMVKLDFAGIGGTGAYFYYGTTNGSILQHGDEYKVVLIDSDSCYIIEEGKINCPPFDCNQSALRIEPSYECIDTLLKARLNLNISGALGGYILTGHQPGELLEQGSIFRTTVTDAAGCSFQITGEIKCQFDSCAFARPELKVDYSCLTDANGDRTGKAVLNVFASSYAGGISFTGNQNGDTLNHLDTYNIQMTDTFGCSLSSTGIIECLPVNSSNDSKINILRLYPNPANKKIAIQLLVSPFSDIKFTLYNSSGKSFPCEIVKEISNSIETYTMQVESLPAGIYYLKVQNKTTSDILRFVKL